MVKYQLHSTVLLLHDYHTWDIHNMLGGFWIKFQKLLIRPEQGKRVCIRVSWHSRLMAIESASLADLAWIGHNQLSYQAGNS